VLVEEVVSLLILYCLALAEQVHLYLESFIMSHLVPSSELSSEQVEVIIFAQLARPEARSCMAIALTVPQTTRLDQEA
jgi:hypothetical protein